MSTTNPDILLLLQRAREPRGKKVPQPIAKKSEKLKDETKLYKPLAKEFLSRPENQDCKIKMEGCTGKATQVHHSAGRSGKQLLNVEDFVPSCTNCNVIAVEKNDAEAREKGFKKTRMGKVKKITT